MKLTVSLEGETVLTRELDPGSYSLGRLPENDLVLDHHEVSRRHARLVISDSAVHIEDAGSTNGILLDGQRVEAVSVASGQTVVIKPYQLVFKLPTPAREERTVLMDSPLSTPEATVVMSAPAWRLLAWGGPGGPREHALSEGLHVLGRSAEADIQLEHDAVSRRHAQLEVSSQGVKLTDLGSKAGTLLNQNKVHETNLRAGDRLTIGPFILELAGGPETEAISSAASGKQGSAKARLPGENKTKPRPAADGGRRKRRLLLLAACGVLLILVIMAIGQSGEEDKPAPREAVKTAQPAAPEALSPAQEQERREQAEKLRLAQANLEKARQALAAEDYPQAMSLLEMASALAPGQTEPRDLLAKARAAQTQAQDRQARQAQEAQERAQKISQLTRQAESALAQGQHAQAQDLARQLLDLDPGNAAALAVESKAQAFLQRQDQERKAARAAEEQRAQAARRHYDDGVRALQAGDRVGAVRAWKRVAEADRQGATPYLGKARAFLAENEPKLRAKADPLHAQGQERLKAGDVAGAMASFRAALREDPWHPAAGQALRETESRMARQVEELYQEGLVLESLGDAPGALAKWRKALELTAPASASPRAR